MNAVLSEMQPLTESLPTISLLAPKLEEPFRSRLKELRNQIKQKLNQIRAIMMGNQAVLIYNMDFYHRLFNSHQESPPTKAYNASGKVTQPVGSSLLKKSC